ncbi:MAG: glycosyltransferase family 39 protein [Terriglobales bacterium]
MAGRTILAEQPATDATGLPLPRSRRRLEWLFPLACCVALFVQLMFSVRHLSQTADESTHLYSGYRALRCADFSISCEHPPLAKVVAALPLLAGPVSLDCGAPRGDDARDALRWLYGQGHDWQMILARSRAAVSLFAIVLCMLVWIAARQMYGFGTAALATLLLVFEPNILSHGALVTTDMVVTVTFFFAVYTFYRWTRKRSLGLLVLTGVAAGLTLVAKQSGVIIVPLLFLLAAADAYLQSGKQAWRRAAVRSVAAVAMVCLIAAGAVWAAYGFRFSAFPDGQRLPSMFDRRGSGAEVVVFARDHHLLPEAYLEGLQRARVLARAPIPVFMLGHMHPRARWYFFPVTFLIKLTLGSLVLIAVGAVGLKFLHPQYRREVLFLALPAVAFLLACMSSRMPPAMRHALPMFPFVLVLVAAGCVTLGRRYRWAVYGLALALVVHAGSSLRAFPFYLSYSNELWGGSRETHNYLPASDWGEGYIALREYLTARDNPPCWLASPYQMDIAPYQVPCRQFWGGLSPITPIPPRVRGLVILSSAFASNPFFNFWLGPFTQLGPSTRLAGSALLVYEGDFDTSAAAVATELLALRRALREGRPADAVKHGRTAVQYGPSNATARYEYCRALVASDEYSLARRECTAARDLLRDRARSHDLAEARSYIAEAEQAIANGRRVDAITSALRAVEVAPESGTAQAEFCRVLRINGLWGKAAEQCSRARALLLRNGNPDDVDLVGSPALKFEVPSQFSKLEKLELLLHALGERPSLPAPWQVPADR